MSVLSFFFAGMPKNAFEIKGDAVPPYFPRVKVGAVLDVSTAEGPFLSGPVARFTKGALNISSPPGCPPFPSCDPGVEVDVRLHGDDASLFRLWGAVERADGENCRLTGLELIPCAGLAPNRPLFIDLQAAVYEEEDAGYTRPELCKLVQAGNEGFTLQSEFPHGVEERIRVVLSIEKCFPLTIHGQIVRMEMSASGVFRFELRCDHLDGPAPC